MPAPKKRRRPARSTTAFLCPHCGEQVETWPDLGGGEHQIYLEDCPVCCRPNRITAVLDESLRDFNIEVTAED